MRPTTYKEYRTIILGLYNAEALVESIWPAIHEDPEAWLLEQEIQAERDGYILSGIPAVWWMDLLEDVIAYGERWAVLPKRE